jgi:threonine dehydratase
VESPLAFLADSIAVKRVRGTPSVRELVGRVVLVEEEEIAQAICSF